MRQAALSVILSSLLVASAGAATQREIVESFTLEEGQEIFLDFPVGELVVEKGRSGEVEVELELRCKRRSRHCEEVVEEIELASRSGAGRLGLDVTGHPRFRWDSLEMEGRVLVPADRPLTVDMGVGELEIYGLRSDVEVDLGVGEVRLEMSYEHVRSLRLSAGVGETELRLPEGWHDGRRSHLIGSRTDWHDGPGEARIWIEVGVGEASVDLD